MPRTQAGVPVIVDPMRGTDYSRYRGATTMTPNRLEAELATGRKIARPEDAFEAGRILCRDLNLEMAIITLDRDGMALVWPPAGASSGDAEMPNELFRRGPARSTTLRAPATWCWPRSEWRSPRVRLRPRRSSWEMWPRGLEVEKVGVAVIPREEIRAALAAAQRTQRPQGACRATSWPIALAEDRAAGRRVVFTNGCFDLLHVGHVTYLQEAAGYGDRLVVAVNSDTCVKRLKGANRPVITEHDRAAMLAALACVDYVVVFEEDTPQPLLTTLRPDVLVKGGTYTLDEVVGHEIVEAYGGQVVVTGVVAGVSTIGHRQAPLPNVRRRRGRISTRRQLRINVGPVEDDYALVAQFWAGCGSSTRKSLANIGHEPGCISSELDWRRGHGHADVARRCARAFPHARIVGIMRPYVADVLAGTSFLDEQLFYDPRSRDRSLHGWQFLRRLRAEQSRHRGAVDQLLAHGPAGLVQRRSPPRRLRARWTRDTAYRSARASPRQGTLHADAGARRLSCGWPISSTVGWSRRGSSWPRCRPTSRRPIAAWQRLGLPAGRHVVALNSSGAFGSAKLWPNGYFAELARKIVCATDNSVLVLCGPSEREIARDIVAAADHPRVVGLADEQLSIGLTKACVAAAGCW